MLILNHAFFTKNTRHFSIWIEQDLFGDLMVRRNFGRKGAKKGRTITEICENLTQAKTRFSALCLYRAKNRHYERQIQQIL